MAGRLEVRGWVEGSAETGSRGAGRGCHTPVCPRSLLEEECHTLERMIPVLQVSGCPEPFCRVWTPRPLTWHVRATCVCVWVHVCMGRRVWVLWPFLTCARSLCV